MADKYFYSIGRRKTAVATVRLFKNTAKSLINDKEIKTLYPDLASQKLFERPFIASELDPKEYSFTAKTAGGGKVAQIGAIQLGIARSIVKMDPEKKSILRKAGLMTRDPRMVERKKTGLRKARKAEQYSKR